MGIFQVFKDASYNRNLYKTGKADRKDVRKTTVGWRKDPINHEDGQTPDPGNCRIIGVDPVTGYYVYDTPSGNLEYYTRVPTGWDE